MRQRDTKDEAKARAEAKVQRREQIGREREQARAEAASTARAVDEKTARLKALRLAKEETDRDATELAKREQATRPSGGHAQQEQGKRQPPLIANPDEVKGG
jgi:hypothetical protein